MRRTIGLTCLLALVLTITACGGGGASSSATSGAALATSQTWPSSGDYSAVVTTGGTTSKVQFGLTFLHPSAPTTEFPIQAISGSLTDTATLYSGLTTASTGVISNVKPHANLYIIDGDIKRINFAADGSDPKTKIRSAGSSVLCTFKDGLDAQDYDAPNNTSFVATTKGVDGTCGTADDAEASITFSSAGIPMVSPLVASIKTLGVMRDSVTLKPTTFVYGGSIATKTQIFIMRVASNPPSTLDRPPISKVVSQASNAVVAEFSNRLTVWSSSGLETVLDAAITAGTGWVSIGYDTNNFYVYRTTGDVNNTSTLASATWKIVKITRVNPVASILASGSGTILSASMGTDILYATTFQGSSISLSRLSKANAGAPTLIESGPSTTLPNVLTSSTGVHLLWRVTGAGSSTPGYTIAMIDETGATLYSAPAAFPSGIIEPSRIDLGVSENRSVFSFYTGYGSTGHSGSALKTYNGSTKKLVNIGTLPGAADFGSAPAIASNSFDRAGFLGGVIAPLLGSTIQSSSAKVFTFDSTLDNSLRVTTSKQ
jgi:hypothetical protein